MTDHDVAVVGGGPAGCSAAIFTARYGLATVVFDRGAASLPQCGYLANYPGFPGGIDVETFLSLVQAQAASAGATYVPDLIECVEPAEDGGFRLDPQSGDPVTAERVVAATRYEGAYLQALCGDEAFETVEHHGEETEQFDRAYADPDGRTPIEGLYVASPTDGADRQAVMAAGRGARAAHAAIADARRADGYPDPLADVRDWVRRYDDLDEEWTDRERWEESVRRRLPEDGARTEDERAALCAAEADRLFEACLTDAEIADRRRAGHRRLVAHLDDDAVLERAREIERARGRNDGERSADEDRPAGATAAPEPADGGGE